MLQHTLSKSFQKFVAQISNTKTQLQLNHYPSSHDWYKSMQSMHTHFLCEILGFAQTKHTRIAY